MFVGVALATGTHVLKMINLVGATDRAVRKLDFRVPYALPLHIFRCDVPPTIKRRAVAAIYKVIVRVSNQRDDAEVVEASLKPNSIFAFATLGQEIEGVSDFCVLSRRKDGLVVVDDGDGQGFGVDRAGQAFHDVARACDTNNSVKRLGLIYRGIQVRDPFSIEATLKRTCPLVDKVAGRIDRNIVAFIRRWYSLYRPIV